MSEEHPKKENNSPQDGLKASSIALTSPKTSKTPQNPPTQEEDIITKRLLLTDVLSAEDLSIIEEASISLPSEVAELQSDLKSKSSIPDLDPSKSQKSTPSSVEDLSDDLEIDSGPPSGPRIRARVYSTANNSLMESLVLASVNDKQLLRHQEREAPMRKSPQIQERDDDLMSISEKFEFDFLQIPARLDLARLYWNSTGIGKVRTRDASGMRMCPYSLKLPKSVFSVFTNPLTILGFGTAIPLYFVYLGFAVVLVCLIFAIFYPILINFKKLICLQNRVEFGAECSILTFLDPITLFPVNYALILTEKNSKIFESFLEKNHLEFTLLALLPLISTLAHYYIAKTKSRNYHFAKIETTPSEFTILLEGIKKRESEDEDDAEAFIQQQMDYLCKKHVKIEKVNLANSGGIFNQMQENVTKQLNLVKKLQNKAQQAAGNAELEKFKLFDKRQILEEERLEDLQIALKDLERDMGEIVLRDRGLAFVTLETNIDCDDVLYAFRHKYRGICTAWAPWCRIRPKYGLGRAPEPEDLDWAKIGFSAKTVVFYESLSYLVCLLLSSLFLVALLGVKAFFEVLEFEKFFGPNKADFWYPLLLGEYLMVCVFMWLVEMALNSFEKNFGKNFLRQKFKSKKVLQSAVLKIISFSMVIFVLNLEITRPLYFKSKQQKSQILVQKNPIILLNYIAGHDLMAFYVLEVVLRPVILILDLNFLKKVLKRLKLENGQKPTRNKFKLISRSQSAAERAKGSPELQKMSQEMLYQVYERPDPKIDSLYSHILFVIFFSCLTVFYCPLITLLLSVVAIISSGFIEMRLLYFRYKAPNSGLEGLSEAAIRALSDVPKALVLNYLIFFRIFLVFGGTKKIVSLAFLGSWDVILALFVLLFPLTPLFEILDFLVLHFGRNSKKRRLKRFKDERFKFETDYDLENPLTKGHAKEDLVELKISRSFELT